MDAMNNQVPAQAEPEDPMDWRLPCAVRVGHGTHGKGTPLRSLVRRMQLLYDMSQEGIKTKQQLATTHNWMLLAFRAMNDADGVLSTVVPEDLHEDAALKELRERLKALAGQVPLLLGMGYAQAVHAADRAAAPADDDSSIETSEADARPFPPVPAVCACFPGTCRGGQVVNGKLPSGQQCREMSEAADDHPGDESNHHVSQGGSIG